MKKAANEITLISIILCITILLGRIRSKRKFGSSGIAGNASDILCRHCAKALQPFSSSQQNWLNGLPVERQFMIFFRKPPDSPLNCLADLVHARLQKVSRHQVASTISCERLRMLRGLFDSCQLFKMERRQVKLSQGIVIAISYKGRALSQICRKRKKAT